MTEKEFIENNLCNHGLNKKRKVKFKPEWCRENEIYMEYFVKEDNGDRLFIQSVIWNGSFRPIELVRCFMIEDI